MIDLRHISIQVIKANQTPSGAYLASPTFSQYGYSWLRDGTWIAHSMDCVGEHASAEAFHRWTARTVLRYKPQVEALLEKVRQDMPFEDCDLLPTRFTTDSELGQEDWSDFQLDGYGAWLWGAVEHCQQHNPALWPELRPAAEIVIQYLEALWESPNYDCWEEFRDEVHTATLAALYGGLNAVQQLDPALVPADLPARIRAYVTTYNVAAEGHFVKSVGNPEVDASLLWMAVPFNLVDAQDPRFLKTLAKIEQDLCGPGGGVYRYRADTYFGGGQWLLLSCWLAWVYVALNRESEARDLLAWVETQAEANGHLPEQVAHHLLDESYHQPWIDRWGTSASPLLWSHAMYLIVLTALEKTRA